ncbi:hypothetical protein ACHAWF_008437 [Thalassiosira exigua]
MDESDDDSAPPPRPREDEDAGRGTAEGEGGTAAAGRSGEGEEERDGDGDGVDVRCGRSKLRPGRKACALLSLGALLLTGGVAATTWWLVDGEEISGGGPPSSSPGGEDGADVASSGAPPPTDGASSSSSSSPPTHAPWPPWDESEACADFVVEINADERGDETSWELFYVPPDAVEGEKVSDGGGAGGGGTSQLPADDGLAAVARKRLRHHRPAGPGEGASLSTGLRRRTSSATEPLPPSARLASRGGPYPLLDPTDPTYVDGLSGSYSSVICLPRGRYRFVVKDAKGDGMWGSHGGRGGGYELRFRFGGRVVKFSDGKFGKAEEAEFEVRAEDVAYREAASTLGSVPTTGPTKEGTGSGGTMPSIAPSAVTLSSSSSELLEPLEPPEISSESFEPPESLGPASLALCAICPDGIALDAAAHAEDLVDVAANCEKLIQSSALYPADSDACVELKVTHTVSCCPTPVENPCRICADGIAALPSFASTLGEDEAAEGHASAVASAVVETCERYVAYAETLDVDSDECREMRDREATCCPELAEDPCRVCPDGVTVGGEAPHGLSPSGSNETLAAADPAVCDDVVRSSRLHPAASESCLALKSAHEPACCPDRNSSAPAASTLCEICPAGITTGGEACEGLVAQLAETYGREGAESETCRAVRGEYEATCCPTDAMAPAEDPCLICPEGTTLDEDGTLAGDASAGCHELIKSSELHAADSDECRALKPSFEASCCVASAPSENPCLLCPGGIAVRDDSTFSIESSNAVATCLQSIELAKTIDAGTDACTDMKTHEETCCPPTPVEDPCVVCPDGSGAGSSVEDSSGGALVLSEDEVLACLEAVEAASTLAAGTNECRDAQRSAEEASCCPAPAVSAAEPCSFCPEGYVLDATLLVDEDSPVTCELAAAMAGGEGSEGCERSKAELGEACCVGTVDPVVVVVASEGAASSSGETSFAANADSPALEATGGSATGGASTNESVAADAAESAPGASSAGTPGAAPATSELDANSAEETSPRANGAAGEM